MYDNDKNPSRNFGDSFPLTNWILDSGSMCNITPQVSNYITGSLEYTAIFLQLRPRITSQIIKKDKHK